ncbi:MAG: leucyl/phenylalanyl-tRNA--protein transferase [Acidimicrobiales bacterium]
MDPVFRTASAPVEPPPSRWRFPTRVEGIEAAADHEVVALGADLEPGTLLAAYRAGLFPMTIGRGRLGWWSPDPRGVIPLGGLRMTRSWRRSCWRYEIRVDTVFDEVMAACADRHRPGAWIDDDVVVAYRRLHALGWAHSVEAWDSEGVLAGGLYGVAIGGLFAGESMFHQGRDASKVALATLVERLRHGGYSLLDVQWPTPHLRSLGAVAVDRRSYHRQLRDALERPAAWSAGTAPSRGDGAAAGGLPV